MSDPTNFCREFILAIHDLQNSVLYIDDSGTSAGALPEEVLVSDFHLMAGVLIPSANHAGVESAHECWLNDANKVAGQEVDEFHATELVNPKSGTVWHGVSISDRLTLLKTAYRMLIDHAAKVLHLHIGKDQYDDAVQQARDAGCLKERRWQNPRMGLDYVFSKSIGEHVEVDDGQLVIVHDDDGKNKPRFQPYSGLPSMVWRSGIAYLPSSDLPGLQLADLAAYSLNRVYHAKHRRNQGNISPFDEMVEVYAPQLPGLTFLS